MWATAPIDSYMVDIEGRGELISKTMRRFILCDASEVYNIVQLDITGLAWTVQSTGSCRLSERHPGSKVDFRPRPSKIFHLRSQGMVNAS